MIFTKKQNKILYGTLRTRNSFCLLPLEFGNLTYWLHYVEITEEWTKDYVSVIMDGWGYNKDGWKIINVKPK